MSYCQLFALQSSVIFKVLHCSAELSLLQGYILHSSQLPVIYYIVATSHAQYINISKTKLKFYCCYLAP